MTSIFDWDMATLGDPLIDLGTLRGYWSESDRSGAARHAPGRRRRCISDARRHHAAIRRSTGIDSSGIEWYEAFAMWKTAVVVQQIYIRYARGQTKRCPFRAHRRTRADCCSKRPRDWNSD